MSGPPNINNGPPSGSGRGWLRTPPPTYFRSPSPWVPPGSTANIQGPGSLTGSSESQYFSRYNASPTYLVQPVYRYQHGEEINEIQNQNPVNVNVALQSNTQSQAAYDNVISRTSERHTKKEVTSTHVQQIRHLSPSHHSSSIVPPVAKKITSSSQRMQPMQSLPSIIQVERPQSRGPNVRYQTPSVQYAHFEHPSNTEPSNQPQYVIYDYSGEAGPTTAEIIANQSQDYVDEKLAEYQATIHLLQGE